MTAALPQRLPLWRAIAGFGVLAILCALLISAGFIYLDNYRLDRYMRDLASRPASVDLSDATLNRNILDRAQQLGLPVHATDIAIARDGGKLHITIAKYTVQTSLVRMDLRLPSANSR